MNSAPAIILQLKQAAVPAQLEGMKRFGINTENALGVSIPSLRKIARAIKTDHKLAFELWETGIHEARILASMVADPAQVTKALMDEWVKAFNSWDICDQVCGNLFDRTSFAISKAIEYSGHDQEFIKRAGFVIMAEYAVHNKTAPNEIFLSLLPIVEREAWDERNFVKKAVNWALRQMGKRNHILKQNAIKTSQNILKQPHRSARWIASNALTELNKKI